jgi:predicted transposase YbfD/YdcC
MELTTPPFRVQLPDEVPFAFHLEQLAQQFVDIVDQRKRRGIRYPLPVLLTIAVLGKLAGQSRLEALADWAKQRAPQLAQLFGLPRAHMPHQSTWSRIFGAIDVAALEARVAHFFRTAVRQADVLPRGSTVLVLDGKTVRGTIPTGSSQGLHLLAAYLPQAGVVLAQAAVACKENEIVVAPSVLAELDLTGIVATGDAMHAQRTLSVQVVEQQHGDYLWFVKENQPSLLASIQDALKPLVVAEGWPVPPQDIRTHSQIERGHGRLEERSITITQDLAGYHDWPYLQQAFRLVRRVYKPNGSVSEEERYGITSLPRHLADAERVMTIARQEWGIENGLHYRRDVTLDEDAGRLRRGNAPHAWAILNNAVIGVVLLTKATNLAAAQRAFDFPFDCFLARLT